MSKTIEIWEKENAEGDARYSIYSPDGDGEIVATGYTLDASCGNVIVEDGLLTIDIESDKYFHLEEDDSTSHVTISVTEEKPEPEEFAFPYRDAYNFSEKVTVLGVPDTMAGQDAFSYMPSLKLHMEYDNGSTEPVAVTINGTRYELDS